MEKYKAIRIYVMSEYKVTFWKLESYFQQKSRAFWTYATLQTYSGIITHFSDRAMLGGSWPYPIFSHKESDTRLLRSTILKLVQQSVKIGKYRK